MATVLATAERCIPVLQQESGVIGCGEIASLIAGTPQGTPMPESAKRRLYDHLEACRACRDKYAMVVAIGSSIVGPPNERVSARLSQAEIAARVRAGISATD